MTNVTLDPFTGASQRYASVTLDPISGASQRYARCNYDIEAASEKVSDSLPQAAYVQDKTTSHACNVTSKITKKNSEKG
ncbi:hypothetical protein FACS1894122_07840 [Alphaproteobacteria bacterium]|nr:hypothetical protein FACS1894122_07840 [Alphaproteobacteria bacterium]